MNADSRRVVLVTGGTRGIGRAIAEAFFEQGDLVIVCGRTKPSTPLYVDFVQADVRGANACENLIEHVVHQHGTLDVLVNNAGGSPAVDSATVSPRFSEKIVQLNLLAPLWLAQAANARMQKQAQGGVILNIASVSGLRASPTTAAYGAAKAGLINLTKTFALEWAPKVRVAALSPGLVATENTDDHYEDRAAIEATIPMARFCSAQDVAHACTWMASEAASYLTGHNVVLDGGGDWPAFLRPKG